MCTTTLDRASSLVSDLWLDKGTTRKLSINTTYIRAPQKPDLEALVQSFWVQEHTGILPSRDIAMSVEDADSLRFLWSDDIESDVPPQTLQMLVHIFGAKDSLTCAIHALQQTARDNCDEFSAAAIEAVLRFFYVDDLLKSIHSQRRPP